MSGLAVALVVIGLGNLTPDAAVGARAEVRAGRVPISADRPPQETLSFEVTPMAAVRVQDRRQMALLRYAPRFFWRLPNPLELARPLVFHQADSGYRLALSDTVRWELSLSAGIGELDYTASSLVFDPAQSAVLRDDVVLFARYAGTTGLAFVLTRQNTLRVGAEAERSGPLAAEDQAGFPRQDRVALVATDEHVLTRRDTLVVPARAEQRWFSTGDSLTVMSGGLGYRRRLDHSVDLELFGGAARGRWELDDGTQTDEWLPEARAVVRATSREPDGTRYAGSFETVLQSYVDPLRVTFEPRVGVLGAFEVAWNPGWVAGIQASLFTAATAEPSLEPEPLGGAPSGFEREPRRDETLVAAALPVTHRFSENWALQFGVQGSSRAPHFRAPEFQFSQIELWAFCQLTAVFGTSNDLAWAR